MASSSRGGLPTQRERFRSSLLDAFDGVDIVQLQSAEILPLPASAEPRMIVRHPAVGPFAAPPMPPFMDSLGAEVASAPPVRMPEPAVGAVAPEPAAVAPAASPETSAAVVVVAPLLAEITVLATEMRELRTAITAERDARRHDMLTLGGALVAALSVALIVLAILLHA